MSVVTDWAQAAGSLVGGLGGLAGFYALYAQRQDVAARRLAPPPALEEHVLTLRKGAEKVVGAGPQRQAFFEEAQYATAAAEIERLAPAVQQRQLRAWTHLLTTNWNLLASYGSDLDRESRREDNDADDMRTHLIRMQHDRGADVMKYADIILREVRALR